MCFRLSLGSHTGYSRGRFALIAGHGGEHADRFYSWRGFMEGACL